MMIQLLFFALRLYEIVILVRVLLSWIHVNEFNPIVIWIYRLTEPILEPIRNLLPTRNIGLDLSPLIVLLLLQGLERLLAGIL